VTRKLHGIEWLNVCDCPGPRHRADCTAPWGESWNPTAGCRKVDHRCKHCYAETFTASARIKRLPKYAGLTDERGRFTGECRPWPEHLDAPLKWKHPRTVFVNSMSDLFHEDISREYIAAVFAVMAATGRKPDGSRWHEYVVLTKRPELALEFFDWLDGLVTARAQKHDTVPAKVRGTVLSEFAHAAAGLAPSIGLHTPRALLNVAIGVSISDQETADEFLPLLARIPGGSVVSAEPLLGPVDLSRWLACPEPDCYKGEWDTGGVQPWGAGISEACSTCNETGRGTFLDWVIVGAESGSDRRPCKLEWIQDLGRDALGAQVWENVLWNGKKTGREVVSGPALFVKQADVCEACAGLGQGCIPCDGTGQTGKLRKGCPELYIPGRGAQQWRQFPAGWRS
jgi:protein gp37